MTVESDEVIFFEGQALGAEAPAEALHLAGRGGVDVDFAAPWNGAMATARADSVSASLEERFDELGVERATPAESEVLGTGVDAWDEALDGGLRSGLLAEVAEPEGCSGGQVWLLHLLAAMRRAQRFVALVDGADGFDPQSTPEALLEHLLWVRCGDSLEAMKCADALLRDENLGMVLVDLRGCAERELRRVKSADWYRLQRLAERSSAFVCVLTPKAMVPSAQVRLRMVADFCIGDLDASLKELASGVEFEILRKRTQEREGFAKLVRRAVG